MRRVVATRPRARVALLVLVASGVLAVGALLALGVIGGNDPQTHHYVIPKGTAARLDAGRTLELFPARLEVRVGDRLVIVNRDSEDHHVGPFHVDAHGKVEVKFASPGTLKGACALNPEGEAVIEIRQ